MVRGLIVEIGLQKRQITLPMKQNRASEEAGRRGEKKEEGNRREESSLLLQHLRFHASLSAYS
jgi:hypothetical protein